MLTLGPPAGAVFLACGATDLRRGFNGLASMIAHELAGDPLSGTIYVFCNRKRDAVKIFCYHDGGLWVCAKRLEQGTFRWPERGDRTMPLTLDELQRLLSGLDTLPVTRVRDRWWEPPSARSAVVPACGHTGTAAPV
jgi:transposase